MVCYWGRGAVSFVVEALILFLSHRALLRCKEKYKHRCTFLSRVRGTQPNDSAGTPCVPSILVTHLVAESNSRCRPTRFLRSSLVLQTPNVSQFGTALKHSAPWVHFLFLTHHGQRAQDFDHFGCARHAVQLCGPVHAALPTTTGWQVGFQHHLGVSRVSDDGFFHGPHETDQELDLLQQETAIKSDDAVQVVEAEQQHLSFTPSTKWTRSAACDMPSHRAAKMLARQAAALTCQQRERAACIADGGAQWLLTSAAGLSLETAWPSLL